MKKEKKIVEISEKFQEKKSGLFFKRDEFSNVIGTEEKLDEKTDADNGCHEHACRLSCAIDASNCSNHPDFDVEKKFMEIKEPKSFHDGVVWDRVCVPYDNDKCNIECPICGVDISKILKEPEGIFRMGHPVYKHGNFSIKKKKYATITGNFKTHQKEHHGDRAPFWFCEHTPANNEIDCMNLMCCVQKRLQKVHSSQPISFNETTDPQVLKNVI